WGEGDEPERALRRVEWVHVAPLLRDDFPPETLERLARRRRLLLDGHGLVRARRVGPLALDADFDQELLRHVSILKLAEEEARTILGDADLEELRVLGVPEVVVTFGSGGSLVLTRDAAVRLTARPARGDPTGAGDAFSVAYLNARAGGHRPISAARRASALVSALLTAAAPGSARLAPSQASSSSASRRRTCSARATRSRLSSGRRCRCHAWWRRRAQARPSSQSSSGGRR